MVESKLALFIQLMVSGLAMGSIYALVAVGFVLIYKATDILNFAQGEMMMIGCYVCYTLIFTYHLPYILAFLLTLLFSLLMGILLEKIILRPMIGKPVFSAIMVTVGLGSVLSSLVGIVWGHEAYPFPAPIPKEPLLLGGVVINRLEIVTMIVAFSFFVMVSLFFKYSKMGIGMRATAEDSDVAYLMGINVKKIFALSWAIAFLVASTGGILFANIYFMHPGMGEIGIRSFPAAILGGLDSIGGTILGGLIIGIIESLVGGYLDQYFGGGIKEIAAFIVLIIIMMVRPYGLFGTEEIERV